MREPTYAITAYSSQGAKVPDQDIAVCAYEFCDEEFEPCTWRGRAQKFCSRDCKYAEQRKAPSSRQKPEGFQCNMCEKVKPYSAFNKYKKSKTGHAYRCRDCQKSYVKEWFNEENRLKAQLRRYNINTKTYSDLLEKQGGGCAGCGSQEELSVDHDHSCCPKGSCGRCVRGILCRSCNQALGLLNDDVEKLEGLIRYMERSVNVRKN